MNFFKLDLRNKSVEDIIDMLQKHVAAMADPEQVANFPVLGRKPIDATVAAILASLIAGKAAADAAETAWKQANAARDAVKDQAAQVLTARAGDCEATTQDVAALTGTGLPMRGAPQPSGPLIAPKNLRATMGDMGGDVDLMWEPFKGAVSTIVKYKEHLSADDYTQAGVTPKSKFTVTGLTPGKTYAFLVQFVGKDGPGPWSDEAVKMAP